PVHELGHDERGRPYLAMKRVVGATLLQVIERSFATVGAAASEAEVMREERRLLDIFNKVCDALGYAHSRGVIHRDLKPENVMVGEFGEVLVMDWGLARPLDSAAASASDQRRQSESGAVLTSRREDGVQVTLQGEVFGTPSYMPPEQARGETDTMDARADIYSLGAILYHVLTGRPPFTGKSAGAILQAVIAGRLRPPSERASGRRVPRELEAVVAKAMAAHPDDRYASVEELRDDIGHYLEGRALSAADYTPWQLLRKWASRHKAAVVGALSTAAALLAGLITVIVVVSRAELGQLQAAETARQQERDNRAFEAERTWADARELLVYAGSVDFNPASPQEYYQAWLPMLVRMGEAIQSHPDPPREWADELGRCCYLVQGNAQSVGDWGMAQHMAQSAGAWHAVPGEASARRVQEVFRARDARRVEDTERLQGVLRRIADGEGLHRENGFRPTPANPSRGALRPGEIDERVRRLVSGWRRDRSTAATTALALLQEDPAARDNLGVTAPTLSEGQRIALIETVGRLGDTDSTFNGVSVPQLLVQRLTSPTALRLEAEGETASWLDAAARLEASRPGSVDAAFGRPGALRELLADWTTRAALSPPVMASIENATQLLDFAAGTGRLPRTRSDGSDTDEYQTLIQELGDWVAGAARSGSDYTSALLTLIRRGATIDGAALSARQRWFVASQLGLIGDTHSPDDNLPAPPVALWNVIREIRDEQLRDSPPSSPDARVRELAIASATSLVRLDDPAIAEWIGRRIVNLGGSYVSSGLSRFSSHLLDALFYSGAFYGPSPDEDRLTAGQLLFRSHMRGLFGYDRQRMADLERAARLEPDNREIRFHLDNARMGENPAPEVIRQRLHELEADQPAAAAGSLDGAAHQYRSALYIQLRELPDALAEIDLAIAAAPRAQSAGYWLDKGRILAMMRRVPEAIAALDEAIRIEPWYQNGYTNRGEIRRRAGDLDGAIDDLTRAIEIYPRDVSLLHRVAAYTEKGDVESAIADLTRLIRLRTQLATTYRMRGVLRHKRGELEGALADFSRALYREPGDLQTRLNTAITLAQLHRTDEAEREFATVLESASGALRDAALRARRQVLGH
ncbi:MAG: protein kinase, partial [Planctomycetota bacterium]